MVYFKDKSSPFGGHHLIILDDQHQLMDKGTILVVYASFVSGRNVNPRSRLTNSSNLDKCDLRVIGEFHYTKGYWEWTEDVLSQYEDKLHLINVYDVVYASLFTYDYNSDIIKAFCEAWCPLTNTLLTSAGELSISLWDLHDLAGIPMSGYLYDEVVPSALELTGIDEKGDRFIPRSSKYLLYAYHLLQGADVNQCSSVSIEKWVKFLFKKAINYHQPPPNKEKKIVQPKSVHNPFGDVATHERWSTVEETLFAELCIKGNLEEEA
ncbi:UNVERIFIED_CONTAM: hypothetical protein Scaly_1052000 [Sesamum calycinum]|uniref:Aminotransferase-like plant mobile domain-containing protein n=1 Tax=Sesamum calycinum TaxID=2727403 RepID=A0AAW2QK77_9LAMI